MNNGKKTLVVVAHPDDEVLGCGGTIAWQASEGVEVSVLVLAQGVTARIEERADAEKKEKRKETIKQIHAAASVLGAKKTFIFDFPDNRFDEIALLDVVKTVEKVKNEVQPEVVYTHNNDDFN